MGRKNRRSEHYEPLDLTPDDVPRRLPLPDGASLHESRKREAEARRERIERQRNARVNRGIDWSVCLVPGCGESLHFYGRQEHNDPHWRDHKWALPLCLNHLFVAHRQASSVADRDAEVAVEALSKVIEQRQAKIDHVAEAKRREHLAVTDGDIYFVRLNGLVKVGWSRTVYARLQAYGPDVEVLCIYPGTRNDETCLHRQLTPVRARGREWYEDGPIIQTFVDEAVAKWGKPRVADLWSRPKQVVAAKRVGRRR
jgi:hypothetical protein